MKNLDLHIHTVPTVSDSSFVFSMEVLRNYVSMRQLDVIAITNHNVFDRQQYEEIVATLGIPVFPGIEVDIEGGHLILISSAEDISDFVTKCDKIHAINSTNTSSMTETQFMSIFTELNKYLLIPHYDKAPELDLVKIPNIRPYIFCGEVNSEKKFTSLRKDAKELVPVYFSDIRTKDGLTIYPLRHSYVDVEEVTLPSLKIALSDRAKVTLQPESGHELIQVLDNGLKISSGLTVILGERSSGKTYTLDAISAGRENPKYIKQFSLLSADAESEQKRFEDTLKKRSDSVSEEFLTPFKQVIEVVKGIVLDNDARDLDKYIEALIKAGAEAEQQDVFSKAVLFRETLFEDKDISSLDKLISSVDALLENVEYKEIISRFVDHKMLLGLAIALRKKYLEEQSLCIKKQYVNDLVDSIKSDLKVRTAAATIPDIDLYQIMLNRHRIEKFIDIAHAVEKNRVISRKGLHSFTVIATAKPFESAGELKAFSRKMMAFSDAFQVYANPYLYLQELKKKSELTESEYYKYFVSVRYEVLNRYGCKASGGERSEYNLLQQLSDATRSDILLLDEPESSFDNLFLKSDVNSILKEISGILPVVVATHNNTIGASVHPDFVIYTKKVVKDGSVQYLLYSGYPSSEYLKDLDGNTIRRRDVLLNCLEAGESAYIERRGSYEMS